jgi:hypothetical protein
MGRVDVPEEDRRNFFLYVDEFQNFATTSFIKILSEARKYRLNLMLANQYMAQIPEEVTTAILGNVGTLISFRVGANDAQVIHAEFAEVLSQNDLVNISNHQIAVKLLIDGMSVRPFLAQTLPLPAQNFIENRPKVIERSRAQWSVTDREPVAPVVAVPNEPPKRNTNQNNYHKKPDYKNNKGGGGRDSHPHKVPKPPDREPYIAKPRQVGNHEKK